MGLFSSKATCAVCGEICGSKKFPIKDKLWVCQKCYKAAGFTVLVPTKTMTAETIKETIKSREVNAKKLETFQVTKEVAGWLKVDENAREWFIPDGFGGKVKNPRIHSYDDVVDFELLEDGGSIVKGGLGRAVAGGILFGGVGALVGGATGKRTGKPTCTSLKIKITLNDMASPTEYIYLITSETKKNSIIYRTYANQAQEILSLFQVMCDSNKKAPVTPSVEREQSAADEIVKFKQLLDSGIITEEEFEAKKKQLLGL